MGKEEDYGWDSYAVVDRYGDDQDPGLELHLDLGGLGLNALEDTLDFRPHAQHHFPSLPYMYHDRVPSGGRVLEGQDVGDDTPDRLKLDNLAYAICPNVPLHSDIGDHAVPDEQVRKVV
jgi:hypothetical protein